MKDQKKRPAKADGNVVIDIGEKIESKLRSASMAGGGTVASRHGYRPGSYRPGMYGAYRPGFLSQTPGKWDLGRKLGIPPNVKTGEAIGGGLLGTIGNRVLARVVPGIVGTTSKLAVDAIDFAVGLVPFLVQPNSLTTGIALPGVFFLAGSLADFGLDFAGMARPPLSGGRSVGNPNPALAARQRLADLQARMRPAVAQYPAVGQPTRVAAR